jgi:branched-chain amino acid transport system substrate-binding protein
MALAVNEVNRSGGVKGRGQGRRLNLIVADDQSTNATAAVDGFRRLTQQEGVVSVGGIINSAFGLAIGRLAEEAHVPLFLIKSGNNDVLTPSSRYTFRTCLPAAAMAAVPIIQLAQRRGLTSIGVMIADYAWGQSFKASLEEAAKAVPNIRLSIQVAPVPTTNFTPYLRAMGDVSLIVATGHPPGSSLVLAQSGQLGMSTATQGYKALAKRYLRTFPQNEFFEDDALAGYAYVKIIAQAIQNVGLNRERIAAYVHANTFNIPGYAFPLRWTAWGELNRPQVQFAVLTRGAPPESGLNTASTTFWPRVLFKSQPLTPYRPS